MGRRAGGGSHRGTLRDSQWLRSVLWRRRQFWTVRRISVRGSRAESVGGSQQRTVAMEAGSSETISNAQQGVVAAGRRQRRNRHRHAQWHQTTRSGKPNAYPLPATGRRFSARTILQDRDGGMWIG